MNIPDKEYPNQDAKEKSDEEWKNCKISHFIVPLYKKTYLEAYVAKTFVKELLTSHFFEYADGREIYMRTFLCSARSYRKYIMLSDMSNNLKTLIMGKSFPRFIWITEISDNATPVGKAKGLILLDATEANTLDYRPLIFAMCNGFVVQYDKDEKFIKSSQMVGDSFTVFDNNLK